MLIRTYLIVFVAWSDRVGLAEFGGALGVARNLARDLPSIGRQSCLFLVAGRADPPPFLLIAHPSSA